MYKVPKVLLKVFLHSLCIKSTILLKRVFEYINDCISISKRVNFIFKRSKEIKCDNLSYRSVRRAITIREAIEKCLILIVYQQLCQTLGTTILFLSILYFLIFYLSLILIYLLLIYYQNFIYFYFSTS